MLFSNELKALFVTQEKLKSVLGSNFPHSICSVRVDKKSIKNLLASNFPKSKTGSEYNCIELNSEVMETEKQSLQVRNGIIIGLVTGLVLIVYFSIMRLAGLADVLWLRMLNVLILFGGIIWSSNRYVSLTKDNYNWFNTLGNGAITVISALALFCSFLFIELSLDKEMMATLNRDAWFGDFLNPAMAAGGVFIEGLASGMILSYILLSYFYDSKRGNAQTTPGTTDIGEKTVHRQYE